MLPIQNISYDDVMDTLVLLVQYIEISIYAFILCIPQWMSLLLFGITCK
jgi:hypothetical protein